MGMTFKSDESEETYEEYDAYATLNRQGLLRKPFVPYIAAGLVALVAILGFVIYGSNSQNDALAEKVALLAKHLEDIEFRLGNLEQASSGNTSMEALQERSENLGRQFQALETKMGNNLNQINAKLAALEKAQKQTAKTASVPPPKKPATTKEKIHIVKAGETLYQISRKYGLTVDQLKKRNKLDKDMTIRPGQKLVVGP